MEQPILSFKICSVEDLYENIQPLINDGFVFNDQRLTSVKDVIDVYKYLLRTSQMVH